jgi:membrane protein implicated in regulation of membrane protease activity
MIEWWQGLDAATRWFYGAAVFFSAFFLWQFISALVGLSGGEEVDLDAGADVDVDADLDVDADVDAGDIEASSAEDAVESVAAFRLITIRSILAFFTMFFWAAAMYRDFGTEMTRAIIYGIFWGAGGFLAVALVVNMMRRLAETGSPRLASCVGTRGTVYLNIPAVGQGEVRVTVSGVVSHVKARAIGGREVPPGTPIRVVRTIGQNSVEVEPIDEAESGKGEKK